MVRNIRLVLLAISTLMALYGAANADLSAPVRSKQCFEEAIPMLEGFFHEFATSYMDCLLYKETEVGRLYHRINQISKNVIVAPIVDDGDGLYENYIVDPVEKCQNASKRAYVENRARNFKMLDTCLRSTESLVSTTTELTTIDDGIITTTTTDDSENSTGSSLLTPITEFTTIGEPTTTSTTTEKTVEPPKGGGSNSILKTNVCYLLLGLNILKYVLHSR